MALQWCWLDSAVHKGMVKSSKHSNKVQGENYFSCWEGSLPRWDRMSVWDANSLRVYDCPQGKKEIPHTTARQQRQEKLMELHRAHPLQQVGVPPKVLPSTRGVRSIEQVWQGQRCNLPDSGKDWFYSYIRWKLVSSLAAEADPPF